MGKKFPHLLRLLRRAARRDTKSREPRTCPFQTRKRRHSQVNWSTEEKLFHAEQAIKKLKRHTEKGTCQEGLRYKARARIRADNELKTDISRIRKNAQQECVKALTRFHYRECDRFRSELQKEKRPRVPKKTATGTVVNKSFAKKKQAHSAPSENIVTLSNVNKGRYVFSWGGGGLGPQRGGSTVKVSTKRGGPYLM